MQNNLLSQATKKVDKVREEFREVLLQRLSRGEFDGYLVSATKKLLPKLPSQYPTSWEDMMQSMRLYAVEAINDFNSEKGAKFDTWLVKHLNIRSLQWFNWAWLPKMHPEGKGIYSFSNYEEYTGNDIAGTSAVRYGEDKLREAELDELVQHLSTRSRCILIVLMNILDNAILAAFTSKYPAEEVARLTGYQTTDVEQFLVEMKAAMPKFLEKRYYNSGRSERKTE